MLYYYHLQQQLPPCYIITISSKNYLPVVLLPHYSPAFLITPAVTITFLFNYHHLQTCSNNYLSVLLLPPPPAAAAAVAA
jgi:hypothetical protein